MYQAEDTIWPNRKRNGMKSRLSQSKSAPNHIQHNKYHHNGIGVLVDNVDVEDHCQIDNDVTNDDFHGNYLDNVVLCVGCYL